MKLMKINAKNDDSDGIALLARQEGTFMVRIPLPQPTAEDINRDRRVRDMNLDDMPVKFPIILDSGATRHMAHDIELFNRLWDAP